MSKGVLHMTSPSTLSHYRAPQGRPRAIPPCDMAAAPTPTWVETTTTAPASSRPVRRDDESAGEYGARCRIWLEAQDPDKRAARIAKMRATQRKHYLRRKRKEAAQALAAQRAAEAAPERWYTPREVREITGWSAKYIRTLAADWPRRASQRPDRNSNRATEMFGDPSTLYRLRPPPALRAVEDEPPPVAIVAPIEAPRLSLWQRIKRWFA